MNLNYLLEKKRKILLKAFTKNDRRQVCWVRHFSSPPLGCESLPGSPCSFTHLLDYLHWFNCSKWLLIGAIATSRSEAKSMKGWLLAFEIFSGFWSFRFEIQDWNWMLETDVTAGFCGLNPRQERTASCPLRWLLSWSWLKKTIWQKKSLLGERKKAKTWKRHILSQWGRGGWCQLTWQGSGPWICLMMVVIENAYDDDGEDIGYEELFLK